MSNPPENRNGTETVKVHLEYFKHFTTLSATALVGIVTIEDLVGIGNLWLGLSLSWFGWALFCSVLGTQSMLSALRRLDSNSQQNVDLSVLRLLVPFLTVAVVGGISCFVLGALLGPGGVFRAPGLFLLVLTIPFLYMLLGHFASRALERERPDED